MGDLDETFPEAARFTESFGEYLRRHREASGKTLDGISRSTRISKRYLQALEDNDSQKLPDEAFARGFLKSYAKELGLDMDEVISRYDQFRRSLMPTQVKEPKPQPINHSFEVFSSFDKRRFWTRAGALVVVACVFAGGWFVLREKSTPTAEPEAIIEPAHQSAVEIGTPVLESESLGEMKPESLSPSVSPAPALTVPVRPSILAISALRDGSLSLRVDENVAESLQFSAGEKRTVNVFKDIEIKMDDRAAFQFQYNGKPLDISGPVIKLFNRNLFSKKP